MKNKKLTYFLIPIAIIVWGGIILRIVGFNNNDEITGQTPANEAIADTIVIEKNNFELMANYRDPFLGKFIKGINQSTNKKPKSTKKVVPKKIKKAPIVWPVIDYDGSIRSNEKVIAVMKIDSKKYLLEKGEELNDMVVKEVFPDSVILVFKKETKTFPK